MPTKTRDELYEMLGSAWPGRRPTHGLLMAVARRLHLVQRKAGAVVRLHVRREVRDAFQDGDTVI